jgi:arylformamidase
MTAIDYEAQYNNRARVPEHPAIIEGWARDAQAYRAERPPVSSVYGDSERQTLDLFAGDGAGPLVMFVHGGYWQALHPSFFSHLARGLNARGIDVAIPGYDLCPTVTIGDILAQVRRAAAVLWRAHRRPIVVAGHSAGGHLAACLLATDWPGLGADLPADLVPGAYAISGLFELRPLVPTSLNRALGLGPAEADRLSPLFWTPPAGRRLDAVAGALESEEFLRQSRAIAERWAAGGVETRHGSIEGTNHFTVIAPLADPDSAMTARVAALAGR